MKTEWIFGKTNPSAIADSNLNSFSFILNTYFKLFFLDAIAT